MNGLLAGLIHAVQIIKHRADICMTDILRLQLCSPGIKAFDGLRTHPHEARNTYTHGGFCQQFKRPAWWYLAGSGLQHGVLVLQRRGTILKDDPNNIRRIAGGVITLIHSTDVMSHQHDGAGDFGLKQKFMQLGGDMVGVARSWQRVAPAETGAVIRADASGAGEHRLDPSPGHRVVSQTRFQYDGGRTATCANDVHPVAIDGVESAGRLIRRPKEVKSDRVEGAAAGQGSHEYYHD